MKIVVSGSLIACLLLSGCSYPRMAADYIRKLEDLTVTIETLAEQDTVCMSKVDKLEDRYDYLAPGKNTYLEFDFTEQEAARFEQLNQRLQAAYQRITKKGDINC